MSCYTRYSPRYYTFDENCYDATNTQIKEKEDYYAVYMDLPGFSKSNIEIEIVEDQLTVVAKKDEKQVEKSFQLPKNEIDKEQITAKLENGVLELSLKKNPKFKKRIEIQ